MIHTINIAARYFPVEVEHIETGARLLDSIVLDKQQLQAAQAVGQSSKELIYRLYQRQGFKVLDIGKAEKRTLCVDLGALWEAE